MNKLSKQACITLWNLDTHAHILIQLSRVITKDLTLLTELAWVFFFFLINILSIGWCKNWDLLNDVQEKYWTPASQPLHLNFQILIFYLLKLGLHEQAFRCYYSSLQLLCVEIIQFNHFNLQMNCISYSKTILQIYLYS